MAEPWEEQVAMALEANLAAIRGGDGLVIGDEGYWYTPSVVERARGIEGMAGEGLLSDDSGHETIYALAPMTVDGIVETIGRGLELTLTIDFMLARRHPHSDEVFNQKDPSVWRVQNRLWHDFKKKILSDIQLGGLTTNVNFGEVIMSAEATWVPGWAIVIGQIMPTDEDDIEEEDED